MQFSKNGVAIVILLLGAIGVDVSDNMVLEFVGALSQVVSFGLLIYHQLVERNETTGFFWKKW
jgi:hypothetical protein